MMMEQQQQQQDDDVAVRFTNAIYAPNTNSNVGGVDLVTNMTTNNTTTTTTKLQRRRSSGSNTDPTSAETISFESSTGSPYQERKVVVTKVTAAAAAAAEDPTVGQQQQQFNINKLQKGQGGIRDNSTATTSSDVTFDYDLSSLELQQQQQQQLEVEEDLHHHEEQQQNVLYTTSFDAAARFRSVVNQSPTFRQVERTIIRDWYDSKINKKQKASILMVSGPSGSGKTGLVKSSLQSTVQQAGGYFITGKYDFLQHPEPYKGIVSAFTEFTNQVIIRGPEEVEWVRNAIREAIGDEIHVLTSMIPSLELILGAASSSSSSSSTTKKVTSSTGTQAEETIQRFMSLFMKFLGCISSHEKPLVLLLDDLHWADPCSINVLGCMVKGTENYGSLLVGTYDDSSFTNDQLRDKINSIDQCGCTKVCKVAIDHLTKDDISKLLSEAFPTNEAKQDKTVQLADIAHEKSSGSLSCICSFLTWAQRMEFISYDKITQYWTVDCDEIEKVLNGPVTCFRIDEISHLSLQTRDVMKVAACLGYHFEPMLIVPVLGYSIEQCLVEAMERGFITYDESRNGYSFVHDSVHETFYNLIQPAEKELFQLEIGRRIWRNLDHAELDRQIYVLLSQIQVGKNLVRRENERHGLASLCYHAGIKAAKASTFRTATIYLRLAVGFLQDDYDDGINGGKSWRSNYELCLSVYDAAAEMEMCTANLEEMDILIDTILEKARKCEDKIQAYSTRIYALGMTGKNDEAITIGLEVLKTLGETFPKTLCRHRLCKEVCVVNRMLRGKSDNDIFNLPTMTDEKKIACMNLLQLIFLNTMQSRPLLTPFVALRLMKITLTYGLSVYASVACATYGMTVVGAIWDVEQGFRFGKLALEFLNRYKVQEYLPRVYASYYGCIHAWKKPVRETLQPLLCAHRIGLQTGDIEFSSLCSNLYCSLSMESGVPLSKILKQYEYFRKISLSTRQNALIKMSSPCAQQAKILSGQIPSTDLVLNDGLEDEEYNNGDHGRFFAIDRKSGEMVLRYLFQDYKGAGELSDFILQHIWAMPPSINKIKCTFFIGMIAFQLANDNIKKRKNIRVGKKCIIAAKKFSVNCPSNFSHYLFLLQGELAKVTGSQAKAFEKYTCALALTKTSGMLSMEALANERITQYFVSNNMISDAEQYYQDAIRCYEEWGAHAMVKVVQSKYESVIGSTNTKTE